MSLEEVNNREDEVFRLIYNQQKRIKELVNRAKGMEEEDKELEVREEILRQKIVYRLIWEEIERIYFYSKKFQRDLSVEELRYNRRVAAKELDEFLGEFGYIYNVYYIERQDDIRKKVEKVNKDEELGIMKMVKKRIKQ